MKNLVIFGAGTIAEIVSYYFARESEWKIVAYCVDGEQLKESSFAGLPVVAFEEAAQAFPPAGHEMFVALGYHGLNRLRRQKYDEAKSKGYALASYVCPALRDEFTVGDNSLLFDGTAVQPFAKIGNDVFVWGGAMIGHHARIEDHCWITGGANVGGLATIGEESFLGLNATVGQQVKIGRRCLLGANSLVTRCVADETVIVTRDTEPHRLKTDQFLRLSGVF